MVIFAEMSSHKIFHSVCAPVIATIKHQLFTALNVFQGLVYFQRQLLLKPTEVTHIGKLAT